MLRRLLLLAPLALSACGGGDAPPEASGGATVARVGDAVLSEAELQDALGGATPGLDSAAARKQITEQWVRRELVVQEALRAGLNDEPDVQRSLRESEQSVLEAAYLSRFFESTPAEPTEPEIAAYYEANRDKLTLREPYVRVRLIRMPDPSRAPEARNALAQLQGSPLADSLFALTAREYATDPDGAIDLADAFIPESRLRALNDDLGGGISTLGAGAAPLVLAAPEATYVVSVVERVQPGQVPSQSMVRADIVERLAIRKRKEAEARHIARLRSEAEAGGRLSL